MKIGLIGLGDVATHHIKAINEVDGLELVAVSDSDKSRYTDIANLLSGAEFYDKFEDLLRAVAAVAIATPNYLHAENAIDALNAGKYVLVEKPMAMDTAEAQKMIDAADSTGRVLYVSRHFRFMPEVLEFSKKFENGAYGKITGFKSYFSDPIPINRPWLLEKGGGPLIDSGSNAASVLRLFIPNLKAENADFEYKPMAGREGYVENKAVVHLGSGDVRGSITVEWAEGGDLKETRFYTERGLVVLNHSNHTIAYNEVVGFKAEDRRYVRVYNDFLKSIASKQSNAKDAVQDLKVVEDAYKLAKK